MNVLVLLVVFFLMLFLRSSWPAPLSNPDQGSSLAFGFLMIFAFLVGKKINRWRLPQITGFILAGIVCGPYVLKLLTLGEVKDLQLLDGLALSLIALTAGGEMEIKRLKENTRTLVSVILFQTTIIIAGFILFGIMGRSFLSFFSERTAIEGLALSLLLGTLATATSPATTIAVITETKSKGRYTDFILSAAVIKDFLIIIIFAFSLSVSKSLMDPVQSLDIAFLLDILAEIGGSIILGVAVSLGLILYLSYIKKEMTIFILAVAFLTYQISHSFGLHPLLVSLLAGFLVKNFSSQGEKLILAIEKSSLPVFIIFFAISGASIDLKALERSWLLALIFVVWRGVLKFSGTYLGGKVVKEDSMVQKKSWAGFLSQAGVALGMAIIVERTFPAWGAEFKALVLAVIGINQIIGPILLQRFLIKSGDSGKKAED